ncbi:hypothetical protein AQI95_24715 [Streptomyces yokosukanensis]|uniref:Uncharacterized protein n=1 Tax=Streptomyces yokosukanensis TaxID=67386 RepID=A0A124HF91_9ACTN|nr:hypothetical protein [Streptomyces yokosukanensis]KUN03163.1 hypothetical protein AQI95_24715 [Streptomyces yokosukanensis]
MSRKWSPAAEVARDGLFDQLRFSGLTVAECWKLIDDFAHALAEQQRHWAEGSIEFGDPGGLSREALPGALWTADLIDPRPAGSEEKAT